MSGCTWGICQNATFRGSTQFRRKNDDMLCYFFSIRMLSLRNTDIRRGRDITQIRRYLIIGCERLLDINVNNA